MKDAGKAPNSKHQAPEKHQSSSSNTTAQVVIGDWSLVLLWSLDFGAWNFSALHIRLRSLRVNCRQKICKHNSTTHRRQRFNSTKLSSASPPERPRSVL